MNVACVLVLAAGLLGTPEPGKPSPDCDCKELPRLFNELLEQEFLRNKVNEYLKNKEKFVSISEVSAALTWRLGQYIRGRHAAPQSGQPAQGGGGAAPSLGTDFLHPDCALMRYIDVGEGKSVPVPTSEDTIRQTDCKVITDAMLAHEHLHQGRCRARFKAKGSGIDLLEPDNYLREDSEAYQKGVEELRKGIAALALECGWKGSSRKRKKDGTMVVPTESQVQQLKDAARKKAKALSKRGRR